MSIERQVTYEVNCDRIYDRTGPPGACEETLDLIAWTRDEAIEGARMAGWFVRERGAVVRCPSCAPTKAAR